MNTQASTLSAGVAHDICLNAPDDVLNLFIDQGMTQLVLHLKPTGGNNNLFAVSVLDTNRDQVSHWLVCRWERLFVQGDSASLPERNGLQ
jgi:hypothetical protein